MSFLHSVPRGQRNPHFLSIFCLAARHDSRQDTHGTDEETKEQSLPKNSISADEGRGMLSQMNRLARWRSADSLSVEIQACDPWRMPQGATEQGALAGIPLSRLCGPLDNLEIGRELLALRLGSEEYGNDYDSQEEDR